MSSYVWIIKYTAMKKPKIIIIATIAVLVVFLFLVVFFEYRQSPNQSLRDGLYVGTVNVSGLSTEEAMTKIQARYQKIETEGLSFNYGGDNFNLSATEVSFDADMASPNFHYNPDQIASALQNQSRPGPIRRWWWRLQGSPSVIIPASFSLEKNNIKDRLTEAFPASLNPAIDAAFTFTDKKIEISAERPGKAVDWEKLFQNIEEKLAALDNSPITIKTKTEYPAIYSRDLKGLEEEASTLSSASLKLNYKDKSWPVSREEISSWLSVEKEGEKLKLDFNSERVAKYLNEKIAPIINVAPQDPRFEIKDNKVSSWQLGTDGYELDATSSAQVIIETYKNKEVKDKNIELISKITPPAAAEDFDIKEIVGTGHSNFAGSPKNRRHNIAVGAAAVHGLVIRPGEEFSLITALGEIDAAAGYLPELVIKGDKTIPEYGGGLCQIGTTVFRAAIDSGLPITARRNHSYRVSYYEPAGTDAAIYDPSPDVRFINDTNRSILIQSRIEKDDIYFDFWGTKDGRLVTTTTPVVYNIVKPAPTKIIETEDLKPGEKKCTEKAHNGADAYFDYTVIYPEGATSSPLEQTRRFSSHYVPWQEVCLVGKTASSSAATSTASTTAPSTATSTAE